MNIKIFPIFPDWPSTVPTGGLSNEITQAKLKRQTFMCRLSISGIFKSENNRFTERLEYGLKYFGLRRTVSNQI